ncbi:amino acid permease [Pseudonocardia eucalypti]|uniref:Amino acid permease n=1 Tax=Pseudonocardia eucalypti TaxID=648755 RepID=A0ABP9R5I1_9PSEU
MLGLAAMLGTGVFTVFAPAAAYAGQWLLLAVALAGLVAACNAFSTADLAARYPESGGGYVYGRELLAPWAGRLAGVAFLVGKTGSAAAAGLVFGSYVLPAHSLCAAIPTILVIAGLNALGVRWTVRGAWALVPAVLGILAVVVLVGLIWRVPADWAVPGVPTDTAGTVDITPAGAVAAPVTPLGVVTAAGLVFFAFAGYARIATLGEEVRDPAHTIRRAIPLALGIALVAYLAVGGAVLHALGVTRLAGEAAPLAAAVAGTEEPALGAMVRLGAAAATVSVLLSVLVGVSRTQLAMARRGDLPGCLAAVSRRGTPWRADLVGALVAVVIALFTNPASAVALSACSVLVYYGVINVAALRLPAADRRWPVWSSVLGLTLCFGLAALLPWPVVVVTALALLLGVLLSTLLARRGGRMPSGTASG